MDSIHDRIAQTRKEAGLTQKAFAERLQVSQAYISSLEKGKREVSAKVIKALKEAFDTSSDWLLYGQQSSAPGAGSSTELAPERMPASPDAFLTKASHPLLQASEYLAGQRERILPITVDETNEPNIVLVPVKAQAGYADGRVSTEYMRELPAFSLPDDRFRNGTFRAFEVAGDSMEPTLLGSDIVISRQIQDWRWLRDHELFVVVMNEDVLVKRIRNRLGSEGTLELISDNTFYPPLTIPYPEVREIWQVFARLTLHLPAPTPPSR